jgi:peptidoglycan/LPS O-acetylase OafA/YrhL
VAAIDEMKGVAIALVLIYHCGGVLGFDNVLHGEIGVDIFLILSGLTLAAYSAGLPLRDFVVRRFLRIYPSYWLALALFVWLDTRYISGPKPWEDIWHHILGIHGFTRLEYFSDINDSFWFISLIVAAYVAFACIRRRLDDLSLVFAACGVLTLVATVGFQINGHQGGLISLAVRIPSFFAGVVAGRLLGEGTAEVRFNFPLGLGILCFYYLTFFRGVTPSYTIPAIGIIFTWLAVRRFLPLCVEGRILSRVLAFAGVYSYEIYLFHQPLVREFNVYALRTYAHVADPTRVQLFIGILVALAVTVVISLVVHALVGKLFALFSSRPARADQP